MAIKWDTTEQATPSTGIKWDLDQSQAALSHSQATRDRLQMEAQQAEQAAQAAASPMGLAKETVKGTGKGLIDTFVSTPLRAIGSAFRAPKDIANAVQGKPVDTSPLSIGGTPMNDVYGQPVQSFQGGLASGESPLGVGLEVASLAPIGKGLGMLKKPLAKAAAPIANFLAKRAEKKAVERVASTAETMTKGERIKAIERTDRQQPTWTGGGKFVPSETETRAGQILTGKTEGNPVRNVPIVKKEISTRGQEAETFLEKNNKAISNQEHADMFANKRAEMAKYSTDSEMKAYDEQVGIFSRQLLGKGGFNTANYYKALKEYEDNVTSRLAKGKEALLTETGSAKLQAAKDVREAVRDMIGEKNPEFKPKMYDLASLYDALDNVVTKAEKVGKESLAERYPKLASSLKVLAGGLGISWAYDKIKN